MTISSKLIQSLNRLTKEAGTQIRIRYYDNIYDDVWDEPAELQLSGTVWTSGIVFPLNAREGSSDNVLVKEGKLIDSDKRVYTNGSLDFAGTIQTVDVQIGSPTGDLYTTIPLGGIQWEANGVAVYKKQYIRRLTGSLI